jgi:hypothetical protein
MVLTIKRAELLIIAQWRIWSQECDSCKITDMMKFHFSWLSKNSPDLLVFDSKTDKWHVVRAGGSRAMKTFKRRFGTPRSLTK